jgi:DNA modification methylase
MANATAKFGNKTHTQVLPTHLDIPIKEQFGFFPTSVIKPTNESKKKWKDVAYFNDGEIDVRKTSSGNDASGLQKMSEFHAGLCENIVKYWSMNGSKIVDPFAGRVTRATVSSILGREYYGYEITPNTYKRALEHFNKHNINPTLYNGDGTLLSETPNEFADLVLCVEAISKYPGQTATVIYIIKL